MLELGAARKNKIDLADYDCEHDIQNRMLMADFSAFDLKVLEEILFSPLKVSMKKLARNLDCEESSLFSVVKKLSSSGLLTIQDDLLLIDKEKRKYFEFQISRFSPDFKPDIEFLLGILRKVPIHLLPTWYSIPRSSNNIFESILQKYLLTPQIYQRYLAELNFGNPVIHNLLLDVFSAPDFKISSSDLIARYNLTRRQFEEISLILEFNFACCVFYEKEEDHWIEWVTPFQEWREYLLFLKQTEAPTLDPKQVNRTKVSDFAFIEELSTSLAALPGPIEQNDKLCLLQLAERIENRLHPSKAGEEWLSMDLENRALFLYRHPSNQILSLSNSPVASEKNIREAEKAIKRVLHGKWVFFDDFLKGTIISFSEESAVMLKRTGKHWKYALPVYGEEEKALIKATFFEWLFEFGMVATGTCQGRDCFCVTPFGCSFFEE